jgi:TRAP-type C4-dicarboxylate transport system substrate-binding protein
MKKAALSFLPALLIIFVFLMVSGESQAGAETIELKMAHFMSPMHIQHQQSFVPFAKQVEKLTQGRVKIRIYPAGSLGDPTQLPDAVRTGVADIAFIVPSYSTGRFPRSSVFDLPFLFDDAVHATQGIYSVYDRYIAEDFKDYKVLWLYSCGPGQLHSVAKPIYRLEDLKGMKMRAPSSPMSRALGLWGAQPVSMPLSELHAALDKRIIEGMLTPASAITDFKLTGLIRNLTQVDAYISVMAVVMNKEKYQTLPDYAKKALEQAGGKSWGLRCARIYDQQDAETIRSLKSSGKVAVYNMPPAERQRLRDKVKIMEQEWMDAAIKKGLPAQSMLNAVHEASKKSRFNKGR